MSELACISSCIAGGGPVLSALNYGLIAAAVLAALLLVLFPKRWSVRTGALLKVVLLTSLFALLVTLAFAGAHAESLFAVAHNAALALVALFFALSYLLAAPLAAWGLYRVDDARAQRTLEEEARALGVRPPRLFVFAAESPSAFVAAGFRRTIFLSTAVTHSFSEHELRLVLRHELLHLKSPFFTLKRFLHAVKSVLGLWPLDLGGLDALEEKRLDRKLESQGADMRALRDKM